MSMNSTPSGERFRIGFFGCRNAGKSSTVNVLTGQQVSVVSDVAGTTTDPVSKAIELLPLGAALLIDTPGIDDTGGLGEKRINAAKRELNRTDCAVLVVDGERGLTPSDKQLITLFEQKNIPYITVVNKCDISKPPVENAVYISAKNNIGIDELKERLSLIAQQEKPQNRLVGDLLNKGDIAVLVVPIDEAAPKGRLILPQQQTIRDLLESGCIPLVCRDTELEYTLDNIAKKPSMVITDSQAFAYVSKIVPDEIPLTSFSILMARYKGFLETAVKGAAKLSDLKDGDKVLISEGCTHKRQCADIGTVKLPRWIEDFSGVSPDFSFSSGNSFLENLSDFKLVIHCGGCMLNSREMEYRMKCTADSGTAFTNYGTAIAYMNGILKRTLRPFPDLYDLVK